MSAFFFLDDLLIISVPVKTGRCDPLVEFLDPDFTLIGEFDVHCVSDAVVTRDLFRGLAIDPRLNLRIAGRFLF